MKASTRVFVEQVKQNATETVLRLMPEVDDYLKQHTVPDFLKEFMVATTVMHDIAIFLTLEDD